MIDQHTPFKLLTSNPTHRDPRICRYGVFLINALSAGGDQGFHWFQHEADALAFVSDRAEQTRAWQELQLLLAPTQYLADLPLRAINAWQASFTLRWAGRLEDLWECQSRFAKEIRNDFMPIFFDSMGPETDQKTRERFIRHLGQYAERFPAKTYVSNFRFSRLKD